MSEEQVGPWWAASPSRREGVGVQPEEERNKSQKKKKHLPAGLGPGPQGSPTHHERSVGILIHCRSTGERERKSFFLSLSLSDPARPYRRASRPMGRGSGRWASVPRTNADTGPASSIHWKVWGRPNGKLQTLATDP